jgi:hypothetical protein
MIAGAYVLPLGEPRTPESLGEAIAAYIGESRIPLDRITTLAPKLKTRALRVTELARICADPALQTFTLWNKNDFSHSIDMFFRDSPLSKTKELVKFYEPRHGHVISAALPLTLTDPLRELLAAIAAQGPLAHGFVAGFERYADAMRECMSSGEGPRDPDPAREERIIIDGRRHHAKDKLRRLYPVTIIGPDIWAKLPPMPVLDPMATIEDLGNCKLLTAWPELCEPRDPTFLRGTRALREWLWPYTIQNPADHVDNDPPP